MSMKLGAEPKKLAVLGTLLLVAVVVFWMNSSPSADDGYTPPPARPAANAPNPSPIAAAPAKPRPTQRTQSNEFRPSVRPKRGEDRPDPMTIDPTLKLDVLAKLQQVNVEGPHRSIFDFGSVPPPKPDPVKLAAAKPKVPSPIVPVTPPAEAANVEPPKPQAPPVPLKFFGYISRSGQPQKRAFFVDGEEIHVVNEGDVVKRRYRIVRIGVNSVVVEDTQFGQQQTLPLEEQQG